jgi:hypothetical protein
LQQECIAFTDLSLRPKSFFNILHILSVAFRNSVTGATYTSNVPIDTLTSDLLLWTVWVCLLAIRFLYAHVETNSTSTFYTNQIQSSVAKDSLRVYRRLCHNFKVPIAK